MQLFSDEILPYEESNANNVAIQANNNNSGALEEYQPVVDLSELLDITNTNGKLSLNLIFNSLILSINKLYLI